MKKISRRKFLKVFGLGAASLAALQLFTRAGLAQMLARQASARPKKDITTDHDLVAVKGADPAAITRRAIGELGGMKRFVSPGAVVMVKPNMSWDRTPEYAANTNPAVAATVVAMCLEAGAKRVNVFDNTCNAMERSYASSGVAEAARKAGAKVYYFDGWNVVKAHYAYDSSMEGWPVARDAVECDTFINVPILKHHGSTRLTLSMKNLMGICGGNRGLMHVDLGRKIFEVADFIRPELTIIDAYRYLKNHGPSGGNLADVVQTETVIASADFVLADVYAARFVDVDPNAVPYIAQAVERGAGRAQYRDKDILELTL